MDQIRVLQVIARMNIGGTATYLSNLVDGLEPLGVECLLATGTVPKGESEDSVLQGLPYTRIKGLSREINFIDDFKAHKELNSIIEKFKPHILHSHTFKAGLIVRVTNRNLPVVHTFHGHHLYDPEFGFLKRNLLNAIERKLMNRVEKAVTVGEKVRDELIQNRIGTTEIFRPISPGIKDESELCKIDVRKKFNIAGDQKVVVWLGRFTRVKRPDLVLELAKKFRELIFVMAGDGELFDSMNAHAPENVKLVGFQDKNEMWKLADIGLCTSDSEGMPLSLIEAQMAGVPVVATDVGSVSEIVLDGITGKLAKDHTELRSSLAWVLSELGKSDGLSTNSRQHALEKFSTERMASEHMKMYLEILGRVTS